MLPALLLGVLVLGTAVADLRAPSDPQAFVNVATFIPSIVVDTPYATTSNFLKRRLYPVNRCYLRRPVAERLAKVQADLQAQGLGLKVWDGYRPHDVQKEMWKILPDERYVGNPQKGSLHNRGAAVDVTLVDKNGKELVMPTKFDDFSPSAHVDYAKVDKEAAKNRALLQDTMKRHGFQPLASEWWHFGAPDYANYPVANLSFEQIEAGVKPEAATTTTSNNGTLVLDGQVMPSTNEKAPVGTGLVDRVTALEKEVRELRLQIAVLQEAAKTGKAESPVPPSAPASAPAPPPSASELRPTEIQGQTLPK